MFCEISNQFSAARSTLAFKKEESKKEALAPLHVCSYYSLKGKHKVVKLSVLCPVLDQGGGSICINPVIVVKCQ